MHNGEWGTICDDSPNITAVSLVACKQLGFETVLRADIGSSWNNKRPDKMWLDEIDCFGNETRLDQSRLEMNLSIFLKSISFGNFL